MKWRQEYSHPLMISSARPEEVASTRGNPEPKNMKEVDFAHRDQVLKEMIFAGSSFEKKPGSSLSGSKPRPSRASQSGASVDLFNPFGETSVPRKEGGSARSTDYNSNQQAFNEED